MFTSSGLFLNENEHQMVKDQITDFCRRFPDNLFAARLQKALEGNKLTTSDLLYLLKDYLISALIVTDAEYSTFQFPRLFNNRESAISKTLGLEQNIGTNLITLLGSSIPYYLKDTYALKQKRKIQKVQLDEAIKSKLSGLGYKNYTTAGQRMAVRACLTAVKGSTIFVNLPTGCGKTLIAHASMLFQNEYATSIVILPTVGLALEQAERAKEILEHCDDKTVMNYCWHSDLSKYEKDEIKKNIFNGKQKVLFTSPESLTGGLLYLLFSLAKSNLLHEIIIDEAHLIDTWGTNFRPDFQKFGALVASLRKITNTNFNVILMSATFTQANIDSISKIYGAADDTVTVINGNFLRPEIYSEIQELTENDHMSAVIDKALSLPKPMILYTTKISDSEKFYGKLLSHGISRVALFNGETKYKKREQIIASWKNDDLDIIVANSAFGVGMDKSDVKTILHACVPDNIDRYYQEIGRAGRDGNACNALMIYHPEQVNLARRMNSEIIISTELGFTRWDDMWKRRSNDNINPIFGDECYKLDTSYFRAELGKFSEENIKWNWLTLLFMKRAGLIRMYYDIPSLISSGKDTLETQKEFEKFWQDYRESVIVEVLDSQLFRPEYWKTKIENFRQTELNTQNERFKAIKKIVTNPKTKLCSSLVQHYKLLGIKPQRACGGCRNCDGFLPTLGKEVFVSGYAPNTKTHKPIKDYTSAGNVCLIHFDETTELQTDREWIELIKPMIEKTYISGVKAEPEFLSIIQNKLPLGFNRFWISQELADDTSIWPLLEVSNSNEAEIEIPMLKENTSYFIGSKKQKIKTNEHRYWFENFPVTISVNNFKNLMGLS